MIDAIKRGTAAGAVGGLAYGLFTWLVISPFVGYMERLAHHGHDHAHAVNETTTAIVSAGGGVLWGILLGAAFGAAYYLFEPALPGGDLNAYVLAGIGFLTVSVTPWTVLPPVAPGMEQLYSTDLRVPLYAGLMLLGAIVASVSVLAYNRTSDTRGEFAGVLAAAVPLFALVLLAALSPRTLAGGEAPAELTTTFQWLVAFGQAGLWALLAASYRRFERNTARQPETAATVQAAD